MCCMLNLFLTSQLRYTFLNRKYQYIAFLIFILFSRYESFCRIFNWIEMLLFFHNFVHLLSYCFAKEYCATTDDKHHFTWFVPQITIDLCHSFLLFLFNQPVFVFVVVCMILIDSMQIVLYAVKCIRFTVCNASHWWDMFYASSMMIDKPMQKQNKKKTVVKWVYHIKLQGH